MPGRCGVDSPILMRVKSGEVIMKLQNKTVWITGASRGVGEGMARVFHREGADLIISARQEDELNRVKNSCTDGPG